MWAGMQKNKSRYSSIRLPGGTGAITVLSNPEETHTITGLGWHVGTEKPAELLRHPGDWRKRGIIWNTQQQVQPPRKERMEFSHLLTEVSE